MSEIMQGPSDSMMIESQLKELVRAHVAAHTLAGDALSVENVHFVASRLLLRETKSGKAYWPGTEPERLAAGLLVLFVEEGLRHNRRTVLGVPTTMLFEECVESNNHRRVLLGNDIV